MLEYTFHNTSSKRVDFEFSYHLSHLAATNYNPWRAEETRNEVIPGRGVLLSNTEPRAY
jgi:hypothetical protein